MMQRGKIFRIIGMTFQYINVMTIFRTSLLLFDLGKRLLTCGCQAQYTLYSRLLETGNLDLAMVAPPV
jgi:hypothetical protein